MAQKQKSISALAQSYAGSAGRSRSLISDELANELLSLYEEKGTFTVPVKEFNDTIGVDDDIARAWQIKNILNKNHSDKLEDNQEWRVGTTAKGTLYVIAIRTKKNLGD